MAELGDRKQAKELTPTEVAMLEEFVVGVDGSKEEKVKHIQTILWYCQKVTTSHCQQLLTANYKRLG